MKKPQQKPRYVEDLAGVRQGVARPIAVRNFVWLALVVWRQFRCFSVWCRRREVVFAPAGVLVRVKRCAWASRWWIAVLSAQYCAIEFNAPLGSHSPKKKKSSNPHQPKLVFFSLLFVVTSCGSLSDWLTSGINWSVKQGRRRKRSNLTWSIAVASISLQLVDGDSLCFRARSK